MAKPKNSPPPLIAGDVWKGPDSLRPLLVPISSLHALPGNPRRGDVDAVAASYEEFGQRRPIVIKEQVVGGGKKAKKVPVVLAGNHQMKAALRLSWTHLAVVSADDLSEDQARAFALADNRTSELGTTDSAALAAAIAEIPAALLDATGYSMIDHDLATLAAESDLITPRTADQQLPRVSFPVPHATMTLWQQFVRQSEKEPGDALGDLLDLAGFKGE